MHDARIVNHNIQPAETLQACCDCLLPVFALRDIACEVDSDF